MKPSLFMGKNLPSFLQTFQKLKSSPHPPKKNAFGQPDCNILSKLFLKNKWIN